MAIELGEAYVSILPSARGFGAKLNAAILSDVRGAGKTAGDQISGEMGGSLEKNVPASVKSGLKKAEAEAGKSGKGIGTQLKNAVGSASASISKSGAAHGKKFGDQFISSTKKTIKPGMLAVGGLVG